MQFRQSLLALMSLEFGPKLQMLINQGESLRVVLWQFDFLPQLLWQVCTLNRLQVQIAVALVFTYGRIPCIGKWAAVSRAESSQVVLIAAEGLHCGPIDSQVSYLKRAYFALNAQ